MRLIRCYCQSIAEGQILLDHDESHHLVHVLRLSAGQHIQAFDGKGSVADAVISRIDRGGVILEVTNVQRHRRSQSGRIIIAASIAKGRRFEQIVTQCTELGADSIIGVVYDRTVKLAGGDRTVERYQELAVSAAKQCGRIFLPIITGPVTLPAAIESIQAEYPACQLIFGGFGPDSVKADSLVFDGRDTAVFVGPEGGMNDEEIDLLRGSRAVEVRLCQNTLRVETAAIAFAAVLCARMDR
ncbi:MAG: RsmE family RNA methyltransferase [Planctomycetota bacterium]|nr:RsmE family RNA methyltransferase [Planctomycetota bacterium]